ncbi:acyl-CoA dehydrogenase family protein [Streptomyces sp. LX-29]|uniref:acyl-CoA dehydrogenase family protein n=1 Tax=Streptomyces sp. LX-29 TaxID=2900152 RepID=UPI00240E59E1|nr:acyl-CoA dehydrogenase family protein [Streptomyces sp. LX-29]WFB07860.1 acyl-CoA dehydrogenase family protein [Streptomyces sp. LX-29]
MDAAFTREQDAMRRTLRALLSRSCTPDDVKAAVRTGPGYDVELWRQLAGRLGLAGLAVPRAYGGVGCGPLELALASEEAGRALLPSPLLATAVLVVPLIARLGTPAQRAALLPRIADGRLTAALAVPGEWLPTALGLVGTGTPGAGDWAGGGRAGGVQARETAAGWRLYGQVDQVLDGHRADLLLVAARTGGYTRGRTLLFLVHAEDRPGRHAQSRPARDAESPPCRHPESAAARHPESPPARAAGAPPRHPEALARDTGAGSGRHSEAGADGRPGAWSGASPERRSARDETSPGPTRAASGLVRTRCTALDETRAQARIQLRDTPAELLGPGDWAACAAELVRLGGIAAAVLAAEAVGAADQVLERTVRYARTREQFGRPIGSFQAVKHRLADVHVRVQAARSAAYYAAWAASVADDDTQGAAEGSRAGAATGGTREDASTDRPRAGMGDGGCRARAAAAGGARTAAGGGVRTGASARKPAYGAAEAEAEAEAEREAQVEAEVEAKAGVGAGAAVAGGLALAQALEALRIAAGEAVQLHGGIGFTWEHEAHLFFKRAASDELLFGPVHRLRAGAAERAGLFAPTTRAGARASAREAVTV